MEKMIRLKEAATAMETRGKRAKPDVSRTPWHGWRVPVLRCRFTVAHFASPGAHTISCGPLGLTVVRFDNFASMYIKIIIFRNMTMCGMIDVSEDAAIFSWTLGEEWLLHSRWRRLVLPSLSKRSYLNILDNFYRRNKSHETIWTQGRSIFRFRAWL